jgi:hypothetical protein
MNGRRAHQRDPRLDLALERSACGLWPPPGRAGARRSECGPPTAAAADPFHGVG